MLPTVLAFGCVGIGAFTYYDFQASAAVDGAADWTAGRDAQSVETLPTEPLFVMQPLQSFDEIVARPIFAPSRRPAIDAVVGGAEPALRFALALTGVVIAADTRVALVTADNDPTIHRLRLGQSYNGWKLTAIEHDAVTFRRGDEEHRLKIDFEAAPAPQRGRAGARRPAVPGGRNVPPPNPEDANRPGADEVEAARP